MSVPEDWLALAGLGSVAALFAVWAPTLLVGAKLLAATRTKPALADASELGEPRSGGS